MPTVINVKPHVLAPSAENDTARIIDYPLMTLGPWLEDVAFSIHHEYDDLCDNKILVIKRGDRLVMRAMANTKGEER